MKINPGGKLSLEDIVGRDLLVERILRDLGGQSIVLVAERRMGKTHVLDKLVAAVPSGWVMLKRDVEGVRTTLEFVQLVMADLHPMLTKLAKFRDWLNTIAIDAAGTQIGPVKLPNFAAKHWKQILTDTLSHVGDAPQTQLVVFLWDELPMMLQNIAKSSPQEAMELLDVLRSLRQENPKIRMVFTGSIGLHHVVRQLNEQGYANAPVNDMAVVEVPPLSPTDATDLTKRLFTDNQIAAADDAIFALVAEQVDGIPFYIHHVMRALVIGGQNRAPRLPRTKFFGSSTPPSIPHTIPGASNTTRTAHATITRTTGRPATHWLTAWPPRQLRCQCKPPSTGPRVSCQALIENSGWN